MGSLRRPFHLSWGNFRRPFSLSLDTDAKQPLDSNFIRREVTLSDQGTRLDVFLTQQPEVPARSTAKALIRQGLVELDGRPRKAGTFVRFGQEVRFSPKLLREEGNESGSEARNIQPTVLFEDTYILVIDKPAGMIAHPANTSGRQPAPAVSRWAEHRCPGLPRVAGVDRPGIVHRLDKETSGVMLLAKTEDAFHFMKGEFKARRVEKEYRALCYGEARFDSDFIERNISTHPRKGDRMVVVEDGGREASTFYEVVERLAGATLFACRPRTGRTHQIRVHMTSIGHCLVGDRIYRSRNLGSSRLPEGAPDPARQCLHALHLEFTHPHSRERMKFHAPLAQDIERLIEWWRGSQKHSE